MGQIVDFLNIGNKKENEKVLRLFKKSTANPFNSALLKKYESYRSKHSDKITSETKQKIRNIRFDVRKTFYKRIEKAKKSKNYSDLREIKKYVHVTKYMKDDIDEFIDINKIIEEEKRKEEEEEEPIGSLLDIYQRLKPYVAMISKTGIDTDNKGKIFTARKKVFAINQGKRWFATNKIHALKPDKDFPKVGYVEVFGKKYYPYNIFMFMYNMEKIKPKVIKVGVEFTHERVNIGGMKTKYGSHKIKSPSELIYKSDTDIRIRSTIEETYLQKFLQKELKVNFRKFHFSWHNTERVKDIDEDRSLLDLYYHFDEQGLLTNRAEIEQFERLKLKFEGGGVSFNYDKGLVLTNKRLMSKAYSIIPRRRINKYKMKDGILVTSKDIKNNNCFFDCIKFMKKKLPFTPNEIRKKLKLRKNSLIPITILSQMEELLELNINVFSDKGIIYISRFRKYEKTINLYLKNQHYFLYLTNRFVKRKTPKIRKKEKMDMIDVYYDLETVSISSGLVGVGHAISVSYCYVCPKNNKLKVFHILDDDCVGIFNGRLKGLAHFYEKKVRLIGFNSSKFDDYFMYSWLISKAWRIKATIIGGRIYNIQNFYIGQTLDLCRILNCSLKNACDDFKISDENCKGSIDFKKIQDLYDKGGITNIKKQIGEDLERYNNLDVISLRELHLKVKNELEGNICKLLKMNKRLSNNLLVKHKTIGSVSKYLLDIYANKFQGFKIPGVVPTFETFTETRKAIIGGRAQCYEMGVFRNMASLDVVSLYPYVMCENVRFYDNSIVDHLYPCGNLTSTKLLRKVVKSQGCNKTISLPIKDPNFIRSKHHPALIYKLGIYLVKNIDQSNIKYNIIPIKDEKTGTLNWTKDLIKERWLTTIDIHCLEIYGCKYEIVDGYYWEEKNPYFSGFIDTVYGEKQKQDSIKKTKEYNPSLRNMVKLIINSTFGKGLENIHRDAMMILSDEQSISDVIQDTKVEEVVMLNGGNTIIKGKRKDCYFQRKWGKIKYKYTLAGLFVLSYSRYYMYYFINKYKPKLGDTDSIHVSVETMEKFKKEHEYLLPKGLKQLGQFENEFEDLEAYSKGISKNNICYYLQPKCYCIMNEKGEAIKARFKGITFSDRSSFLSTFSKDKPKKIMFGSIKIKKGMNEKQIMKIRKNMKVVGDFYKQLYKDGKVTVFCNQILKKPVAFDNEGNMMHGSVLFREIKKEIKLKNK
jgi:hypothetical protein